MTTLPRWPVYIPSKGRYLHPLTARMFHQSQVPFFLVVEEPEYDAYASQFGEDRTLVLPFQDRGTSVPARNWIRDHAEAAGHERHWQFDDNIRWMERTHKQRRIRVDPGVALRVVEDFTDRYENIAISGFNYSMFTPVETGRIPPFYKNVHVYSACLINHGMPYRWRGEYNEDTDLCLQALSTGYWCTVAFNAFVVQKTTTMKMKGGNTDKLYGDSDGRVRMSRNLERLWPGVVSTTRKFQRPQHTIKGGWRGFDHPLIRRTDIDWPTAPNNYGLQLEQVAPIKTEGVQQFYDDNREEQ